MPDRRSEDPAVLSVQIENLTSITQAGFDSLGREIRSVKTDVVNVDQRLTAVELWQAGVKATEKARLEVAAEVVRRHNETSDAIRGEATKLLGPGVVKVVGAALALIAAAFGGSQIPT